MQNSYFLKNDDGEVTVLAYLTPDVSMGHEGRWILNRIAVARGTDKGQGWGTKLLTLITEQADDEKATLWLGVSPDVPGYFRRLVKWYTRHGFRPLKRTVGPVNNVMVRPPK